MQSSSARSSRPFVKGSGIIFHKHSQSRCQGILGDAMKV